MMNGIGAAASSSGMPPAAMPRQPGTWRVASSHRPWAATTSARKKWTYRPSAAMSPYASHGHQAWRPRSTPISTNQVSAPPISIASE